jgi:hypothetical protein
MSDIPDHIELTNIEITIRKGEGGYTYRFNEESLPPELISFANAFPAVAGKLYDSVISGLGIPLNKPGTILIDHLTINLTEGDGVTQIT